MLMWGFGGKWWGIFPKFFQNQEKTLAWGE
jgi:hypothetical protein